MDHLLSRNFVSNFLTLYPPPPFNNLHYTYNLWDNELNNLYTIRLWDTRYSHSIKSRDKNAIKIYRVIQKKATKITAYNFASVWSFSMKFGYVIHMDLKFFRKKLLRNQKKALSHCLRSLHIHNSTSEAPKCTKI